MNKTDEQCSNTCSSMPDCTWYSREIVKEIHMMRRTPLISNNSITKPNEHTDEELLKGLMTLDEEIIVRMSESEEEEEAMIKKYGENEWKEMIAVEKDLATMRRATLAEQIGSKVKCFFFSDCESITNAQNAKYQSSQKNCHVDQANRKALCSISDNKDSCLSPDFAPRRMRLTLRGMKKQKTKKKKTKHNH